MQFFQWLFICILYILYNTRGFPGGSDGKESTYSVGDQGSIPGEGNGNLLQCSYLKIPWTEEPGGL